MSRPEGVGRVDTFGLIDRLVEDAYRRSGLYSFHLGDHVQLSDSVRLIHSKRQALLWGCGTFVNLYGHLFMDSSRVLSIAASLGLLRDLMRDDLAEALRRFVSEKRHDGFYSFGDSIEDGDGFHSFAWFNERPVRLSMVCVSPFGAGKDRFIYLLAGGDFSCYGSYDEYFSGFFLDKVRDILESIVPDEFALRDNMDYLERNRAKFVRWFELLDEEFLSAFDELDRRFDIFVRTLYRLEDGV